MAACCVDSRNTQEFVSYRSSWIVILSSVYPATFLSVQCHWTSIPMCVSCSCCKHWFCIPLRSDYKKCSSFQDKGTSTKSILTYLCFVLPRQCVVCWSNMADFAPCGCLIQRAHCNYNFLFAPLITAIIVFRNLFNATTTVTWRFEMVEELNKFCFIRACGEDTEVKTPSRFRPSSSWSHICIRF